MLSSVKCVAMPWLCKGRRRSPCCFPTFKSIQMARYAWCHAAHEEHDVGDLAGEVSVLPIRLRILFGSNGLLLRHEHTPGATGSSCLLLGREHTCP